jgi:hypothetical protein
MFSFFTHICLCRESSRIYELIEVFLSDHYLNCNYLISTVLGSLYHLKLKSDVFVLYLHT